MTRSDWQGLAVLALLPLWLLWWVWVLVPCWVIGGLIRYCRAPPQVRTRRWRIDHGRRCRVLEQYERDTVELLRRRGMLDTQENRSRLRR